jgi:peptide/nickel transport system substrate-binding protein
MVMKSCAALLGGLVLAAVATGPGAVAAGTDVTIAVNELPRSLDPGSETGNVDVRVYYNIFDTLIRRDFGAAGAEGAGNTLVPSLATSWRWVDDTTFELKLRTGVTCHDGSSFDADDVLATFSSDRLWGGKSYYPSGRNYFGNLKTVEKVDAETVRLITNAPDPTLDQRLASYTAFIVCNEALEAFRKPDDKPEVWLDAAANAQRWNPVGTGPYKFAGYEKDNYVKLDAFDKSWRGASPATSLTFKAVPEVAARISGLVAGDYDMAVEIPTDQWDTVRSYADLVLKTIPIENSHVVVFNMSDPLLADKNLRHAMSLAIDRKALIDALWKGQTFTPNGLQLPSFGELYDKERPGYAFDPEAARAALAKSGYKGEEISYRLIPNYYTYNVEVAQILQEMWRAVGIKTRIDFVDSFKEVRAKGVQAYAWSNTYRIPDPTGTIIPLYGPGVAIQSEYKHFTAPQEFNDLATALASTTDAARRKQDFKRMLDIFEDEMPMTILYNPVSAYAMKKTIQWQPYSQFYMDFGSANLSIPRQ